MNIFFLFFLENFMTTLFLNDPSKRWKNVAVSKTTQSYFTLVADSA